MDRQSTILGAISIAVCIGEEKALWQSTCDADGTSNGWR
jgi:hypothetical protein